MPTRRTFLAAGLSAGFLRGGPNRIHLSNLRRQFPEWRERIGLPSSAPDVYAACDLAHLSAIAGEDLVRMLPASYRRQWIDFINKHQDPGDGSYTTFRNHSKLHANGMVIGALGVLGGKMRYRVRLYEPFDEADEVGPWLETIDWSKLWSASHRLWGGLHCFSMGSRATSVWKDRVFSWLDSNLDPNTGWWRRGVPPADRNQALGGAAHILPIYQHHDRRFPYPERLIDSVLAMQVESGRFRVASSPHPDYLELDALYALDFARTRAPGYRTAEIGRAVERLSRYVLSLWTDTSAWMVAEAHPHDTLAMVGVLGLLQRFLPETYPDDRGWTDIFSDRKLYQTSAVGAD